MTPAETQEFEMERVATMRTFKVTLQHPVSGRFDERTVTAHSHSTDENGHLSFATINIDGSRNVRAMFHECRWVQVEEIGTSAHHASKMVTH